MKSFFSIPTLAMPTLFLFLAQAHAVYPATYWQTEQNGEVYELQYGDGTTNTTMMKLFETNKLGANEFCDLDGSNCFGAATVASLAAGSGGKFTDGTNTTDAVYMGGNVGIGTDTPAGMLNVSGTSASVIVDRYSDSIASANLHLRSARGTDVSPAPRELGDYVGTLNFHGYNGTSFTPGAQVASFASEDHSGAGWGSDIAFSTVENGTGSLREKVRITNDGRVGIGTTSPTANLEIQTATGNPTVRIVPEAENAFSFLKLVGKLGGTENEASVYASYNGSLNFDTPSAYQMKTNGTEVLRISNSGNVGIGTTVPAQKLHVEGNIQAGSAGSSTYTDLRVLRNVSDIDETAFMGILGAGNPNEGYTIVGSSSNGVGFTTDVSGTSVTPDMVISKVGNVGIGTTNPTAKLDIYATAELPLQVIRSDSGQLASFTDLGYGNSLSIEGNGLNHLLMKSGVGDALSLSANNSSTEHLTINSLGHVGIGTTAPSEKLEVAGNIIANDPINSNHLATKSYVDIAVAGASGTSLPTCTDGQLLQHNGTEFVCVSGNVETQSMVTGWPDAIQCTVTGTNAEAIAYVYDIQPNGDVYYATPNMANGSNYGTLQLRFDQSGSWVSSKQLTANIATNCNSKTINQLTTDGHTFNFSGGPGASSGKFVDGTNTADAVYTDGNVGIGTTTPNSKLTIEDKGVKFGIRPGMRFDGSNFVDDPEYTALEMPGTDKTLQISDNLEVDGYIHGQFECREVNGASTMLTSYATCSADEFIMSGGGWCHDGTHDYLHLNTMELSANRWAADCYRRDGIGDAAATARAVCCKK